MPLLHDVAALSLGDAVEYFPHPGDVVRRQVDSEFGRVHNLSEDKIDRVPTTVPLAQLLERHLLTAEWVITVAEWTEDVINGVEKGLVYTPKLQVL